MAADRRPIVVHPEPSDPGDLIIRIDVPDDELIIHRHAHRGVFPTITFTLQEARDLRDMLTELLP
jgi:hypothetical protein